MTLWLNICLETSSYSQNIFRYHSNFLEAIVQFSHEILQPDVNGVSLHDGFLNMNQTIRSLLSINSFPVRSFQNCLEILLNTFTRFVLLVARARLSHRAVRINDGFHTNLIEAKIFYQ
uniref:Uncharacterized protein n=1 Tax=Vespula pensylvanica TaxID=30213 RepID=A0A834NRB2_VESPE|nr:hypothetical protein H0235_011011 [Vespula pensylvanica]